jgi:hypothetical protein
VIEFMETLGKDNFTKGINNIRQSNKTICQVK